LLQGGRLHTIKNSELVQIAKGVKGVRIFRGKVMGRTVNMERHSSPRDVGSGGD